jgi:hypothetical protein
MESESFDRLMVLVQYTAEQAFSHVAPAWALGTSALGQTFGGPELPVLLAAIRRAVSLG